MPAHYTHSRSVILCFGGWGLQTLLHVAPRIQAAQEQREASGQGTPDFNRITSYGVLHPQALLSDDGMASFRLFQFPSDKLLPPFYVERLLANIEHAQPNAADAVAGAVLTDSERRAMSLMRETESVLEPLAYAGQPFLASAKGVSLPMQNPDAETGTNLRHASRRDMMLAGAAYEDSVSRLMESHLVDPVRRDFLSPDDPYVQTTLYIVAPLFDPLASALIWPIVSGLMQRMGRRHISTVVGLFATGSYGLDRSRAVEDGATYAALAELETLTGIHDDSRTQAELRRLIGGTSRALRDQVGQPLFDHIYLLDREKSNQGLAEDSHEVAVLAGNALEGFITGSADLFIEEQLGYGPHGAHKRPYSLIGASADYVPVQQILHAVNRHEESRLVREWVLQSSPDAPVPAHPLARRTQADPAVPRLFELGFTESAALSQLAARLPGMFGDPEPDETRDLSVRQSFVMTPVSAAELRRLPPVEWSDAFDDHVKQIQHTFNLVVGPNAMDEAWGLSTAGANTGLAFAAGLEADERMAPQLLASMHKRVLDLIAASPTGLIRAHEQTQLWLHEAEESLQRIELSLTSSMRELGRIQREQALYEWQVKYRETVDKTSSLRSILLRASIAFVALMLLAFGFMWMLGDGWDSVRDGLALAGVAVGLVTAGLITASLHRTRLHRLRQARVELARAEFTDQLQMQSHDGLVRMHGRLIRILQNWEQMLQDAITELHDLSTPPDIPAVPPAGVYQSYLYVPYFNQRLWDRCLSYLRTRLDTQGQRSEERLDSLWGEARWRHEMERILRAAPSSGNPAQGASQAHTIAEFIRQTVRQSVAPVSIQEPNPVRADLIAALAHEFGIEYLLWRGQSDERDIQQQLRAMGFVEEWDDDEPEEWSERRYVESAWNRAKPTANYDVADRLAVYGVTVDFTASSGDADSDLTRALLDEFDVRLLPTQNPFTIIFVRTVHGLALEDLDSMRRYGLELHYLPQEYRDLICLDPNDEGSLYRTGTASTSDLPSPTSHPIPTSRTDSVT